ncbi:hypothetical protein E2562_005744 [Oryza meyeriana var. granulata]|uniref:Uncharacterized protein n=1 Tax=Oryza meyeriana var. granulata TaxID=110450 RepID=A0A6G1F4I8_9ORYZ|nr:hypothetical protein E2562_005744 [Oryza meyeriana var. granulata]
MSPGQGLPSEAPSPMAPGQRCPPPPRFLPSALFPTPPGQGRSPLPRFLPPAPSTTTTAQGPPPTPPVSLAPPRPSHPAFSGDAQATEAQAKQPANLGDLSTGWYAGEEEQFVGRSNFGAAVADSFSNQGD